MFHMQERQLLLSSLFKKPVHNAVRRFSCFLEKNRGKKKTQAFPDGLETSALRLNMPWRNNVFYI